MGMLYLGIYNTVFILRPQNTRYLSNWMNGKVEPIQSLRRRVGL